ncbi:MAG TPA: prolyl oligopeptidase family serine peptidase [Candidatus Elarobacter sp.]
MNALRFVTSAALVFALPLAAPAEETHYRVPPPAIDAALRAPALPVTILAPSRDTIAIEQPLRYPPVADLARPMLRLAGLRIDPATNGIHHAPAATALSLERVADGRVTPVALPPDARITLFRFSPDGKRFAFTNATAHGTELWLGTTAGAHVHRIAGLAVNTVFPNAIVWLPDANRLVVRAVDRVGPAPRRGVAPGPATQETSGAAGQIVTYEDMLADATDEAQFTYYATSRIAIVDAERGEVKRTAARGIYTAVSPSPNGGARLLVERVHAPYSYLFPYGRFPTATETLDLRGARVATLADRPLADRIPADGVAPGPRQAEWAPDTCASESWVEALDGGDPRTAVPDRDRLMLDRCAHGAREVVRLPARIVDVTWLSRTPRALVTTYERTTRVRTTYLVDASSGNAKSLYARKDGDVYHDPGSPVTVTARYGDPVVAEDGGAIWLRGSGIGPDGRRPFLSRLNLASGETSSVFRSDLTPLETPIALLDDGATALLTSRESPADPPNLFVRTVAGGSLRQLTHVADPQPMLRRLGRRLVTYKRADGVDLSFTLYTPPGWTPGTRLPALVWAYPLEFIDRDTASQNTNDTQSFVTITAGSPIFMALAGYAVADNASMPIVGNPATVNDTFVDQLTANAQAVVDQLVTIGVADRERIAVGGHSYGAFMTANLLAHTRLFRAGIARSGAYNRSLTPFGFQNERRSYWEATSLYTAMSPFTYANAIKDPLLLIHGMADDNTGTYPIQSERLYGAIKGNGGTARLVMLPYEAHGYVGRESLETMLAEMVDWLNRWLKPAAT